MKLDLETFENEIFKQITETLKVEKFKKKWRKKKIPEINNYVLYLLQDHNKECKINGIWPKVILTQHNLASKKRGVKRKSFIKSYIAVKNN